MVLRTEEDDLYVHETWCFFLGELALWGCLGRIYGPKLKEVGTQQRKEHYEEFDFVSEVLTAVTMEFPLMEYNVLSGEGLKHRFTFTELHGVMSQTIELCTMYTIRQLLVRTV
jgi:hypothetical protein